jgi:tetratricopeptide (TPR) repeat protein
MGSLSNPLARLSTALGRRYAIERELGRGGMGTVYLALDRKHGRRVAIKILPPDLAAAAGPERFLREIEIAARLTHPHILPLHDSGQAAGLLYYVTPFIEGESLRQRLERGPMVVEEALAIAMDVAEALAHAHAHGVVHRDVKPENILLQDGNALLADFGVARAVSEGRLTDSGVPMGTVAYSSPEQAAGGRELDGRTDIYSLGCVLYEMLVGDTAECRNASQALQMRFSVPMPPARSIRAEVPEWVDRALSRALARDPADRYADAAQFRAALTASGGDAEPAAAVPLDPLPRRRRLLWMSAGAATVAMVGAALAFLPRRMVDLDPKRVVVAGFENRTGDSALAPVGDIAADYIARGLAATRLLHDVYDARAMAREVGQPVRMGAGAGRELARGVGAGTVLSGGYHRDGDSLHFEAQLLDAASGRVVLSLEPAVGPLTSRTQVIELLRQRVMAGFGVMFKSPGFEPWEAQSIPPTYEAYTESLAGSEAAWHYDFVGAARHFRRAAALDSTYPGAKAALAVALEQSGDCAGADSIGRLLEPIVDRLPPVDRGNLDWAQAQCRGDLAGALEGSQAVIKAAPGSVGFTVLASIMAIELFRPRQALAILQRLEPRRDELTGTPRAMYWNFQELAYHLLGEYQRELELNPGSGGALAALGRVGEARQLVDTLLSSNDVEGAQCLALELRAHGHSDDAQDMLDKVVTWYRAHPDVDPASSDDNPCLWIHLSAPYHAGRLDEAKVDYERLAAADSTRVKAWAGLGAFAARRGDRLEVARIDRWLANRTGSRGQADYARARMAALLGNREQAVALLRAAFDSGLKGRHTIHIDPDLESLRDYPPYQELMRPKE